MNIMSSSKRLMILQSDSCGWYVFEAALCLKDGCTQIYGSIIIWLATFFSVPELSLLLPSLPFSSQAECKELSLENHDFLEILV